MIKLEHLLKIEEPKKKLSKRSELLSEIYILYSSKKQKDFRKRENWRRYVNWLKENRINEKTLGRKKTIALWKRKAIKEFKFIREMSERSLAISLAPFNERDNTMDALYYFISMGKDMENRNQNFGGYIMSYIFDTVKKFDN